MARKRASDKAAVIEAYGGKCTCCGESEPLFLVVDHVNDDGASHREEIGYGRTTDGRRRVGSGSIMYVWLVANAFPEGFQLLCANCNLAKQSGGCPHRRVLVDVGQQVERHVANVKVAGSKPVIHSIVVDVLNHALVA